MKIAHYPNIAVQGMTFVTGKRRKIFASMSAREITKNMVRVKSSNIWSYGINLRRTQDKTGDVYVQFKNSNGGAGDIYVYYEVPIVIYRRWLGASSKGHFFHQYIRNNYVFAKLTGDKRTKLKGGVNSPQGRSKAPEGVENEETSENN